MPSVKYKLERCVGTSWGRKVVAKNFSKELCNAYSKKQIRDNISYFTDKGYYFITEFELINKQGEKFRYFDTQSFAPVNLIKVYNSTSPSVKEPEKEIKETAPTETTSAETEITRIEVIGDNGREYVNWHNDNKVKLSLQDGGRTLKIFVTKK